MSDIEPDMDTLLRFFAAMPRQGPGSEAVTGDLYRRVRSLLPDHPDIADMGCGSGAAALVLAGEGGHVTAVDLHAPFLAALRRKAQERGLAGRIDTRAASMLDSGLPAASLDLVWSEGAVYTVGFDAALETFGALLKPGGVAVVSECVWLQEAPPEELRSFWADGYPGMRSAGGTLRAAERLGYRLLFAETLAADVWETGFYRPMEALLAGDPQWQAIAGGLRQEIDLFRRYNRFYGYVHYALRR